MASGRHRAEPVSQPLTRRSLRASRQASRRASRRVPLLVAATGGCAALVGVTLVVTLGPDTGAAPAAAQAFVATPDGPAEPDLVEAMKAARAAAASRAARDQARTPGPEVTPDVVGKLWAKADVNVRSAPSIGGDRIGRVDAVTRVGVTGVTKSGWTQVVADGHVGWVRSTFLSTTKPKPQRAAPRGLSNAPCPKSSSIEGNLTANARAVYRAVCAAYGGSVSSFGGYRPGDSGDHGSGRAVDIMVSGAPGTTIARFVQAHARELHVTYVIYQQRIWLAGRPTSQWKLMEDRGSRTANHYDHVHVSVS